MGGLSLSPSWCCCDCQFSSSTLGPFSSLPENQQNDSPFLLPAVGGSENGRNASQLQVILMHAYCKAVKEKRGADSLKNSSAAELIYKTLFCFKRLGGIQAREFSLPLPHRRKRSAQTLEDLLYEDVKAKCWSQDGINCTWHVLFIG